MNIHWGLLVEEAMFHSEHYFPALDGDLADAVRDWLPSLPFGFPEHLERLEFIKATLCSNSHF